MARKGGNKKACEKYKMSGHKEENKRKRQERHLRKMQKMKERRERIASGELVPQKIEVSETVEIEKERRRKQKAFNRLMATTIKVRPICTRNGVIWGTNRDTLK